MHASLGNTDEVVVNFVKAIRVDLAPMRARGSSAKMIMANNEFSIGDKAIPTGGSEKNDDWMFAQTCLFLLSRCRVVAGCVVACYVQPCAMRLVGVA